MVWLIRIDMLQHVNYEDHMLLKHVEMLQS